MESPDMLCSECISKIDKRLTALEDSVKALKARDKIDAQTEPKTFDQLKWLIEHGKLYDYSVVMRAELTSKEVNRK